VRDRATGYDYVAIGHVTIDRMGEGREQVGGTAAYSGIQAARLGQKTLIITRGERAVIDRLLEPFADELDVWVQDDERTTTLLTQGSGLGRCQRIIAWAGEIDPVEIGDASVVHLAPVSGEVQAGTAGSPSCFVGITPQGMARRWGPDGRIELARLPPAALPNPCSALVISEAELDACGDAFAFAVKRGAVGAITHGERSAEIRTAERSFSAPVPAITAVDELGAGDVFAAALFVSLAAGERPSRAAAFAQAAASLRVAGRGPAAIGDAASITRLLGDSPGSR
jgi:sugar/nucleoside kinase (ribokinase family)